MTKQQISQFYNKKSTEISCFKSCLIRQENIFDKKLVHIHN